MHRQEEAATLLALINKAALGVGVQHNVLGCERLLVAGVVLKARAEVDVRELLQPLETFVWVGAVLRALQLSLRASGVCCGRAIASAGLR